MQKRLLKQIFIGLIYLAILAGIVAVIFFSLYQKPTCQDGILNQGEISVDCGGPCPLCEFQTIKDLQEKGLSFFEVSDRVYDVVVSLKNPNPNYGSGEFAYNLYFYDVADRLITKKQGRAFILPNQEKYIILSNIKTIEAVSRIDFKVDKIEWEKLDGFGGTNLFIRAKRFEADSQDLGMSRAIGIIKNSSPYDWASVGVNVLLFSENKKVIGVGSTQINSLLSGEEREFIVTWFNKLPEPVFDTTMVAETNVFADQNFVRNYKSGEQFQSF